MASRWTKYLSKSGNIRVVGVDAHDVIEDTIRRHELAEPLQQGLGEAMLAGLLLAACEKEGERINLSVRTSGRWKQAMVDAYPEGFVRAMIVPGRAEDWDHPGRGPWANGLLTAIHTKNAQGQVPYTGTVALETGYLDQDMNAYWLHSAQIPSNAVFSKSGRKAILVQAIAGATPEEIKAIHDCTKEIRPLAEGDVLKLLEPLHRVFPETEFAIVEDTPIEFRCNCSPERMEQALLLTSIDDLKYLITDRETIDAKCDFCSTRYTIGRERALELIQKLEDRQKQN